MNLELRGGWRVGGGMAPCTLSPHVPFPMPMHFEDVLIMKHYDLCGNVPSNGSLLGLINFHFTFRNPVRNEACMSDIFLCKNKLREKLATQ